MASRYYYASALAAALASSSIVLMARAVQEVEPETRHGGRHGGHGGWGNGGGGWARPGLGGWSGSGDSDSSSHSGKGGKSGGGGSKCGKSGGSCSSSSSSGDGEDGGPGWHGGWGGGWNGHQNVHGHGHHSGWNHHGWNSGWNGGHHGGWGGWTSSSSSSSSSTSGKGGKSGSKGGKSHGSKGSKWSKCGKSGGGCSSSSSSSEGGRHGQWQWVGPVSHGGNGGWGGHGGWPGPWGWDTDGWFSSSSSSSSSGKSGKSGGGGGSKCGKSGRSCSSSSSTSPDYIIWGGDGWFGGHGDHGGWGGWDNDGWSGSSDSSTSTSSSGKSGKSGGGSGSSKCGKSGGSCTSSSADDDDDNDGWSGGDDNDGWSGGNNDEWSGGGHADGWSSSPGWKPDGWDNDGHYKPDIDYVRSHVTRLIHDSERRLIPKFLRLGFHDCVGGCDGCVDLDNRDNAGLREPIEAIYPIVEKFKDNYSRADVWAMATLVSADLAVLNGRPHGYHFPMRYIGRKDCHGADTTGIGGPDVEMPSNHFTTHELLRYFKKYFDFKVDETVTIMGVHAVAVAHRDNIGFGNKGKRDGWVFGAVSYELNNRYYGMLVGDDGDVVETAPSWHMELVRNGNGIPDRYQWYHEKEGEEERPIMTNSDMALARDLKNYMHEDGEGNEGAVACDFKSEDGHEYGGGSGHDRRRSLHGGHGGHSKVACPVASETMEMMIEYKYDNEMFLYDFEKVLEKMLKNGY